MRYKLKKTIATFLLIAALTTYSFSLAGCVQQDDLPAKQNLELSRIEADEAKNIALTHANVYEKNVEFINVAVDNEDDDFDVVFKVGSTYYEYEINVSTGNVDKYSVSEKNIDTSSTSSADINSSSTPETSSEKAKLIAFKSANVLENDVTYVEITSDNQNGIECYDIDFTTSSNKYEYKISKTTGEVLEKSQENRSASSFTSSNKVTGTSSTRSKPNLSQAGINGNLTVEQAKDAAVKYVSDSIGKTISNADITNVELDTDDSVSIYEIDIYFENALYAIEMDSKTGSVTSFKQGRRAGTDTSPQSASNVISKRIDIEKVKSKVLAHANIKSSDVTFTKSELDIINGVDTYEFEFHTKTAEYEYDVDAYTGEIISFEHNKK